MELQKEYRKAKLGLAVRIAQQHLQAWRISLDPGIERAVLLLQSFGFSTRESCEGHKPPYAKVDTYRLFWPYVKINLNQRLIFHFEEEKPRMECVAADPHTMLRRLDALLAGFVHERHPFPSSSGYRYDLSVLILHGLQAPELPLRFEEARRRHWNIPVTVCDAGVQGILTMPQELLNDRLRSSFLKRTKREMEAFASYLEWVGVERGIETVQ